MYLLFLQIHIDFSHSYLATVYSIKNGFLKMGCWRDLELQYYSKEADRKGNGYLQKYGSNLLSWCMNTFTSDQDFPYMEPYFLLRHVETLFLIFQAVLVISGVAGARLPQVNCLFCSMSLLVHKAPEANQLIMLDCSSNYFIGQPTCIYI